MHKVVLDSISDNMSLLVHNGKYGVINTAYPTIMGYYIVKLLSEPYILSDDKTVDKKVIKSVELIVKAGYISIMRSNTNWYWQQLGTKDSVIIVTRTIAHPCLYVSTIEYVADITRILCNKNNHRRLYKDIQFLYLMQITTIF